MDERVWTLGNDDLRALVGKILANIPSELVDDMYSYNMINLFYFIRE